MQFRDTETWSVTFDLPRGVVPDVELNYSYLLRSASGAEVQDWGRDRVVNPAAFQSEEVTIIDSWNAPGLYENAFYTEPFYAVLLKANHTEVGVTPPPRTTHVFKVKAPLLARGQTLCLLGNAAVLGNWNTSAPVL